MSGKESAFISDYELALIKMGDPVTAKKRLNEVFEALKTDASLEGRDLEYVKWVIKNGQEGSTNPFGLDKRKGVLDVENPNLIEGRNLEIYFKVSLLMNSGQKNLTSAYEILSEDCPVDIKEGFDKYPKSVSYIEKIYKEVNKELWYAQYLFDEWVKNSGSSAMPPIAFVEKVATDINKLPNYKDDISGSKLLKFYKKYKSVLHETLC